MDWSNMSALFADDIIAGTDTIANVPLLILDEVKVKVEAGNSGAQAEVAKPMEAPHATTTNTTTSATTTETE